jgi:hypothetical protein
MNICEKIKRVPSFFTMLNEKNRAGTAKRMDVERAYNNPDVPNLLSPLSLFIITIKMPRPTKRLPIFNAKLVPFIFCKSYWAIKIEKKASNS